MINLSHILGQGSFWLINKQLARLIGRDEAFLLSDLITKYEYFESQGSLTEIKGKKYMFLTYESIENDTLFSKYQQSKLFAKLIELGFVLKVASGMPKKTFYKVDKSVVMAVFACSEETSLHEVKKLNDMQSKKSILHEVIPIYNYKNNYKNKVSVDFDKFWEIYDKKVDRKKTEKKFLALSKKEIDAIFNHLPSYLHSTPDKKYRKNPLTYLNSESWNDEIVNTEPIVKYSDGD